MNSFYSVVLNYRYTIIVISVIFSVLAIAGIGGLDQRTDYRSFLDPNYIGMLELDEIEDIFGESRTLFFIIAPNSQNIFEETALEAIQDITEQAWTLPYSARVDSLANFQHTTVDQDTLSVEELLPQGIALNEDLIARAKSVSINDPSLRNYLVSESGNSAVVAVNFNFDDDEKLLEQELELEKIVLSIIDNAAKKYPSIKFMMTGTIRYDQSIYKYQQQLNEVFIPLMLIIMAILLFVFLRSFWGVLWTGVIVILTGTTTMGIFGWFKLELDPVASIAPIVIMTLAVADSVHMIAAMLTFLRAGKSKSEALLQSLKLNYRPIFLTSLTTTMGVFTFAFSDFPALRKLGLIIAVGVTIAFVLSVTLLPILLSLSPIRRIKEVQKKSNFHEYYVNWLIKYHRIILPLAVVCSLLSFSAIPKIILSDTFENSFAENTEERQAMDFIADNLSGFLSYDISIFSADANGIYNPELLQGLDTFEQWAVEQEGVDHVRSINHVIKRLNQNLNQGDSERYRIPDNAAEISQYLLLYELSLPYGLDLNNQINMDKSGTRLVLMLEGLNSGEMVALKTSVQQWFVDNMPDYRVMVTGVAPMMAEVSYIHMIPSMAKGAVIAILMVSLVLLLSLRSWFLGLIGMLANVVPIAVGYGYWAVTNELVSFPVMSVAGICLGVVVDFVVHFLDKYRRSRLRGDSVDVALHYVFATVSKPLCVTMCVLVIGFGVLSLSPHLMVADLGFLAAVIIFLALVFDLLVLPCALLVFDKKSRAKPTTT